MITEDYVSFEIAKLLKEKGFNELTTGIYYKGGTFGYHNANRWNSKFLTPISAPTLQMVMKWFRRAHDIDISIIPLRSHKEYLPRIESNTISHDDIPCKEYEEAAEVAIKYCLENLINKN